MFAVAFRTVALGVVYGGTLATIVLALVCRWTPKDDEDLWGKDGEQ